MLVLVAQVMRYERTNERTTIFVHCPKTRPLAPRGRFLKSHLCSILNRKELRKGDATFVKKML